MSNLESYPPVFRHQKLEETQIYDPLDEEDSSDPIPVIDLHCMDLHKLGEACRDWGLFRLVNHQVPLTLMSQLQEQAKKIFSLSFESKQGLFTSPVSYFWGTPALTPSGTALSRGSKYINWVEGFNVPLSQLSQFQADEDPMLHSFRYIVFSWVLVICSLIACYWEFHLFIFYFFIFWFKISTSLLWQ